MGFCGADDAGRDDGVVSDDGGGDRDGGDGGDGNCDISGELTACAASTWATMAYGTVVAIAARLTLRTTRRSKVLIDTSEWCARVSEM